MQGIHQHLGFQLLGTEELSISILNSCFGFCPVKDFQEQIRKDYRKYSKPLVTHFIGGRGGEMEWDVSVLSLLSIKVFK